MPSDPLNGLELIVQLNLRLEMSGKSQGISYCLESGSLGLDLIDSDNFEGQRSNFLKYPSDYLVQPPGKYIHYE